jgi:hypothetical protein
MIRRQPLSRLQLCMKTRGMYEAFSHYKKGIVIVVYGNCVLTTHPYPRRWQRHLRYSFETPTFYRNDLAMRNIADVTDGEAIAV